MSTPGTPAQPYYPQVDKSVDPKVNVHLQRIYPALNDHDKAIVTLKQQLADVVAGKTVIQKTASSTTSGSSTVAGVSSFNTLTGAVSFYPSLGTDNDQSGNTSYATQTSDSGALIIVNDPAPVAISLNSAVTPPYFFFITNFGAGTATLTPTTGTINGGASFPLPENYFGVVVFDGTNWEASAAISGAGLTGYVPKWNSPSSLGDSHIDDGVTTPGWVTIQEPAYVGSLFSSLSAYAQSIAGPFPNPYPSDFWAVTKGLNPGGAFLITDGTSDGISAGECLNAYMIGTFNVPTTNGAGGLNFSVYMTGPANINGRSWALLTYLEYAGSATCFDVRGLWVKGVVNSGGGSITNNYGIFVDDQTVAANNWAIKTGKGLNEFGDTVKIHGVIETGIVYSVAGTPLPTAASVGMGARAFVSDATVSTFASAYVGGGANKVPVYSDGTGWFIG